MSNTRGINHLGLAVRNLTDTRNFFVNLLGWTESGYDADYPKTAVSDGVVRLTLWQVDHHHPVYEFDRRHNIGLHHLALEVETEADLDELHQCLLDNGITIEFAPELLSGGPRKHMMCYEPGGIRIEFIWAGL
ncbi:VOC family protein [Gynuella sp.]|uniref:VOC family protein n=1 Tax=Gynuella sp. TaxID=2969146 RepID=UPI003D0A3B51